MGIIAFVFVLIGFIFLSFPSIIAKIFSKGGYFVFKNSPFDNVTKIYEDVNKIKIVIRYLGIVNILQGIILFLISFFM